ncbi:ubiquinol-cytochrome c reductase iron-sulfur subunit [Lysinibacillus macroides]|nr:ubiquinol-cytochrome c reductase iron-sulfur subunit [Lysinibacillus macroides]
MSVGLTFKLEGGKQVSKNRVSRRQFLSYTLTGVGGFMAAGMLMPMVRFAIDPVLQSHGGGDFVQTELKVTDITEEPVKVDFSFEQVDAWYKSDVTSVAWVYKSGDQIIALSPVCTHLGCMVDWGADSAHPDQFFCPCHAGRYEKNGKNIAGTPPTRPLDEYDIQEKDGYLMIGPTKANTLS